MFRSLLLHHSFSDPSFSVSSVSSCDSDSSSSVTSLASSLFSIFRKCCLHASVVLRCPNLRSSNSGTPSYSGRPASRFVFTSERSGILRMASSCGHYFERLDVHSGVCSVFLFLSFLRLVSFMRCRTAYCVRLFLDLAEILRDAYFSKSSSDILPFLSR